MTRENIERQLADELEGCMQPYRAWQYATAHSKGLVPGGVQAFGPDDPTPSWGEGDGE